MSSPKVAFITGLPEQVVDVVLGYNPEGWTTEVVYRDTPLEEQKRVAADADFIMVYRASLHDDVLRAADRRPHGAGALRRLRQYEPEADARP